MRRSWVLFVAVMLVIAALPSTATGRSPSGLHLVASPAAGPHAPKISSRLLDLLAAHATAERHVAGAGTPEAKAEGGPSNEVDVSVTLTAAALPAGIDRIPLAVYGRLGRHLEARVPDAAVASLAALPGVALVEPLDRAFVSDVTSQGVAVIGASQWQAAGITGAGVKVGVIDTGFGGIAPVIGTEVNANTQIHCYSAPATFASTAAACSNDTDTHGTAVAETISDVAPGAALYLASPWSLLDMKSALDWMAAGGVRIVNASITAGDLFEGPGDGSSPLSLSDYSIVDYAASKGMVWINAAGNEGGNAWMGAFAPDAVNPGWHDFAPGVDADPISLEAGDEIGAALRWQDSWSSPAANYDLILTDSTGTEVASSKEDQPSYPYPVESIKYTVRTTGTYHLAVWHKGGTTPPIELLVLTPGAEYLAYTTATRSLPAPADSRNPGEVSVGAVPYDNPTVVERYSSIGPTADDRTKPDLVAPDCAQTSIEAHFCGTSQAAPHTSGAAALLLAADPSLTTPAALAAALRGHTQPLGGGVNSTSGYGLLTLGPPGSAASPSPSASPGSSPSPSPSASPGPGTPGTPPPYRSAIPPAGTTSIGDGWASEGLATSVNGAIVHVAYELDDQILYRRSTDGGLTFEAPLVVGQTDTAPGMPAVVATGDGRVTIVWPTKAAVQIAHSADYGTTWGSVGTVGSVPGEGPVTAAIDSGGHLLVGWTDVSSHAVVVQLSTDDGATFGSRMTLGTTSSVPWRDTSLRDGSLALAFGSSGAAYATWMATPTRLLVRRSTNGGSTWSRASVVDTATVKNAIPAIGASGAVAVVGYGTGTSSGSQIALRFTNDRGAHWQARRLVPFGRYGEFEVAISQIGARTRLATARCANATCTHVGSYYRESSSYGKTWSSAKAISSASLDTRAFAVVMGRRPLGLVVTYVGGASRLVVRRI